MRRRQDDWWRKKLTEEHRRAESLEKSREQLALLVGQSTPHTAPPTDTSSERQNVAAQPREHMHGQPPQKKLQPEPELQQESIGNDDTDDKDEGDDDDDDDDQFHDVA